MPHSLAVGAAQVKRDFLAALAFPRVKRAFSGRFVGVTERSTKYGPGRMATLWARLRREPFAVLARALARLRREWLAVPAAVCWLAAVLIMRHRLQYGVSHTDEAFTSATTYAFLLGHRPYLDEIQIHQNAALLLAPFFWVYVVLNKTADGIVLFNRYLYWAYLIVCSALAFRLVRRLAGVAAACCVGALIVTFGYANILCLSYNTCGALGLFCGVMCCATGLLRARPGRLLFAGCLFFLSAVFSYPGLLLVVPVYADDASSSAPPPDASAAEWQQVISSQIQAFRDHDAAAAFSFAAASFQQRYTDPKAFFAAILGAGYAPIMNSRSESFGAYQMVADGVVLQDVKLVAQDQTLYDAVYQLTKEANGWRVSGVQLGQTPGIGV